MKRLLLLLITLPLQAFPPIKALTKLVTGTATAESVAQQSVAHTFFRNAMLVTGTLKNPLMTGVSYGVGKIMETPVVESYLTLAAQGELTKLQDMAHDLTHQIKDTWLPMRKEQEQLRRLQEIMGTPLAKDMAAIKKGTFEQATCALFRLAELKNLHDKSNIDTQALTHTALRLLHDNPQVEPCGLEMVLTTPTMLDTQSPKYIGSRVLSEIQKLDMSNLESYMMQSSEILKKMGDGLTTPQKEALLAKAIPLYIKRLGVDFKASELGMICDYLFTMYFGEYYLTEQELMAKSLEYQKALDNLQIWYNSLGKPENEQKELEQVVNMAADLTYTFMKGRPITAAKKLGGIIKAFSNLS